MSQQKQQGEGKDESKVTELSDAELDKVSGGLVIDTTEAARVKLPTTNQMNKGELIDR